MLKEGDKAPDFTLPADTNEEISLKGYKGKNVILYFYPKDNTPGCTREACDFRDEIEKFEDKNAIVLGISKDSVDSHKGFKEKLKLPFMLLSDSKGKVCESYGAWKEKMMYGKKMMGIERTTFLIGHDGRIKKIFSKVKVDGHVASVLDEIF